MAPSIPSDSSIVPSRYRVHPQYAPKTPHNAGTLCINARLLNQASTIVFKETLYRGELPVS